jgi:hypothetical protein
VKVVDPTVDYDVLDCRDEIDQARLVVEWMFSSVCNFACSYCPVHLHDGRVRWPDYDVAMGFCRRVVDHYEGHLITFLFTGGEVTRYRRFVEMARELRDLGPAVAVLSNASQPLSWWTAALPHLDEAILSFHPEFADRSRFGAVVQLLSSRIPTQVNVMMPPDRFEECRETAEWLRHQSPAAVIHEKPILDNWKRLAGYDSRALQVLQAASQAEQERGRFPHGTLLKGDMIKRGSHSPDEVVTPIQLLLSGQNHWRGWRCGIGLETLMVRWDEVYRGICRVGGLIGSIYDPDIRFPDTSVVCTASVCNCIGGIKATKRRVEAGSPPRPASGAT